MEEKSYNPQVQHNIVMEGRSRLVLSGIKEIESFEEESVSLITSKGNLTVRGNDMKMESYNSEVGDLVINGNIYALVYTNESQNNKGFFGRIFK